MQICKSYK